MSVWIPMNDNLCMCDSDVRNPDLCVTSTFRIYMYRRVHPWSQDRHTVRGPGEESERWNNTKKCLFIFMIFTLFYVSFENCKNIYSWQWFWAVARKLVILVSHSG
jgi:hypothetical protein